MKTLTIRFSDSKNLPVKINPRWMGQNLAVHREIIVRDDCNGIIGQNPNKDAVFTWTVTHMPTGFSAGKFDSFSSALSAAQSADTFFNGVKTKDEAKANENLCNTWKSVVKHFKGITT